MGDTRRAPSWPPRALQAEQAAYYVGLSTTTFQEVVAQDVPSVQLTEKRRAWLREDLDAWLDVRAGKMAPSQNAGPFVT